MAKLSLINREKKREKLGHDVAFVHLLQARHIAPV